MPTGISAIRYQIAIMLSIFVILNIAVLVTVRMALKPCFDGYGMLRPEAFETARKKARTKDATGSGGKRGGFRLSGFIKRKRKKGIAAS